MTFYKTLWAILFVILLVAKNVSAQPEEIPPDVFEAASGGYLYADYPGVFDDAEGDEALGDGITIETWVYFTERPPDRMWPHSGHWIIVAKPGSYYISLAGRTLNRGIDRERPEGHTRLIFAVERQPEADLTGRASGAYEIQPEQFPFSRWIHIAYQLVVKKDGAHRTEFYDRHGDIKRRYSSPMGRTEAPLLVGGAPFITFNVGSTWAGEFGAMEGFIDELRISKGWRYVPKGNIRPQRHFRVDDRTIALWRFEEGPGAPFYRDSSGNDYTLFPGGALAVQPRGKMSATWGSLKKDTF